MFVTCATLGNTDLANAFRFLLLCNKLTETRNTCILKHRPNTLLQQV